MGSVLFTLYINGLLEERRADGTIECFADDTMLFCAGKTEDEATQKLNVLLEESSCWFAKNKRALNAKKTVVMVIKTTRSQQVRSVDIILGSTKLELMEKVKYLGVLIDSNLSWKAHFA